MLCASLTRPPLLLSAHLSACLQQQAERKRAWQVARVCRGLGRDTYGQKQSPPLCGGLGGGEGASDPSPSWHLFRPTPLAPRWQAPSCCGLGDKRAQTWFVVCPNKQKLLSGPTALLIFLTDVFVISSLLFRFCILHQPPVQCLPDQLGWPRRGKAHQALLWGRGRHFYVGCGM